MEHADSKNNLQHDEKNTPHLLDYLLECVNGKGIQRITEEQSPLQDQERSVRDGIQTTHMMYCM